MSHEIQYVLVGIVVYIPDVHPRVSPFLLNMVFDLIILLVINSVPMCLSVHDKIAIRNRISLTKGQSRLLCGTLLLIMAFKQGCHCK